MSRRAFDTEIAIDLVVNAIPLAIILFFVATFAVFNPWGVDPLQSGLQFAILLSIATVLAIATGLAARVIETDPRTRGESASVIDGGDSAPTVDDGDAGDAIDGVESAAGVEEGDSTDQE
nr:DUF6684 family protein [Halosolutus amylolyticus]